MLRSLELRSACERVDEEMSEEKDWRAAPEVAIICGSAGAACAGMVIIEFVSID